MLKTRQISSCVTEIDLARKTPNFTKAILKCFFDICHHSPSNKADSLRGWLVMGNIYRILSILPILGRPLWEWCSDLHQYSLNDTTQVSLDIDHILYIYYIYIYTVYRLSVCWEEVWMSGFGFLQSYHWPVPGLCPSRKPLPGWCCLRGAVGWLCLYVSHKKNLYFPLYCLFNRDPYSGLL